jgi:hypothetical protein
MKKRQMQIVVQVRGEEEFEVVLMSDTYTLRPKIFAPFDFYRTRLTIRLIQIIYANVKTIT